MNTTPSSEPIAVDSIGHTCTTDLLAPGATLEHLFTGTTWAEGPVWIPALRVVRWSDIPGNRIMEFRAQASQTGRGGETVVYRGDAEFTNGRTLDLDGHVIQCSHGRRAIERDANGDITTLVDRAYDVRLNSPNDVVVASDGSIWFTDPDYGITQAAEGHHGDMEYGGRHVFRFDESSGTIHSAVTDMIEPNGLAFSPDESTLYVSDTAAVLGGPGPLSIRAYPITLGSPVVGGVVGQGRMLVDTAPFVVDGFRVDEGGCLWASHSAGVAVFSPGGQLLLRIPIPEAVANLCFGGDDGRDLYIAASTSLYRIRTTRRDANFSRHEGHTA